MKQLTTLFALITIFASCAPSVSYKAIHQIKTPIQCKHMNGPERQCAYKVVSNTNFCKFHSNK